MKEKSAIDDSMLGDILLECACTLGRGEFEIQRNMGRNALAITVPYHDFHTGFDVCDLLIAAADRIEELEELGGAEDGK